MKILSIALALGALCSVAAGPLEDYLNEDEAVYKWERLEKNEFTTIWGSNVIWLRVTSLIWNYPENVWVQNRNGPTTTWEHDVIIFIPANLKDSDTAVGFLAGGRNNRAETPHDNINAQDLKEADMFAIKSETIVACIKQIPNAKVIFENDPEQKERMEDDLLAYAWAQFLKDPDHNIRWLPRLYMVKGTMQSMRGAQEYLAEAGLAKINGWVVMGASKRGWTTWLTGSVTCNNCPTIRGIIPMVPIEPDFKEGTHHMWKSYGAFTFAFKDYFNQEIIMSGFDDDSWKIADHVLDPLNYPEVLSDMPKLVIVASDDEFMMFEWTSLWWDRLEGEKYLLVIPNTEHSMFSNMPKLGNAAAWFIKKIKSGDTSQFKFESTFNETEGKI